MSSEATGLPPDDTHLLRDPNLHVIFGVTLMAVLGVSSVTPAFPEIAETLDLSPRAVGLLVAVFTLPGVGLTPILGVLGDRFGRKRILVPSLVLFAVAGTACSLARQFPLLLLLRFLQGAGAAALGIINVTLVGDLYEGVRRTAAMGYNASVLSMGTAVYPLLGGALALLGWHYPFVLPILALPVALVVLVRLRNPEPQRSQPLGAYLRGAVDSVLTRQAIALFVASLVAFVVLYGAYLTYLPFLMRGAFDASALLIGLVMSGASLATGVTSFTLGTLARRFSERTLVRWGFVCYAMAMVGIPLAHGIAPLLIPVLVFGVANGITIPSILTQLAGLAPRQQRAAFMSVNGMVLRLGQTLGPVVAGGMLHLWGLAGAYYGSAFLAVLAVGVISALLGIGRT